MISTSTIRPGILNKILSALGYTGREGDDIPQEWLDKVNALNAYQLMDAFLNHYGVFNLTGEVIEALDELRSAVEHHA